MDTTRRNEHVILKKRRYRDVGSRRTALFVKDPKVIGLDREREKDSGEES